MELLKNFIHVAQRKVEDMIRIGYTANSLDSLNRLQLVKRMEDCRLEDRYALVDTFGKVTWHTFSSDLIDKIQELEEDNDNSNILPLIYKFRKEIHHDS